MINRLKRLRSKARLLYRCYRLLRDDLGRRESLLAAWLYVKRN